MKLIIAEQGNNAWLAHGTPHLNVRSDYTDTETGIRREHTYGEVVMYSGLLLFQYMQYLISSIVSAIVWALDTYVYNQITIILVP